MLISHSRSLYLVGNWSMVDHHHCSKIVYWKHVAFLNIGLMDYYPALIVPSHSWEFFLHIYEVGFDILEKKVLSYKTLPRLF